MSDEEFYKQRNWALDTLQGEERETFLSVLNMKWAEANRNYQ